MGITLGNALLSLESVLPQHPSPLLLGEKIPPFTFFRGHPHRQEERKAI